MPLTRFHYAGIYNERATIMEISMLVDRTHPEDIKAAIRKRYGSVKAFVEANDLPTTGVSDIFRGRTSKRVSDAIERVLQGQSSESNTVDGSSRAARSHP